MRYFALVLSALILSGCGLLTPYQHDIQQGNVMSRAMVADLTVGMTKDQVLLALGQPVLHSPYESNRWDYVYTYQKPRQKMEIKKLILYFNDDKLSHYQNGYPAVQP